MGACASISNSRALSGGSARVAPEDIKSSWSKRDLGSFQETSKRGLTLSENGSINGIADSDRDDEDEVGALANRRPKNITECCISLIELIYFYRTFVEPLPDGTFLSTAEVVEFIIIPILDYADASRWLELPEDIMYPLPYVPPLSDRGGHRGTSDHFSVKLDEKLFGSPATGSQASNNHSPKGQAHCNAKGTAGGGGHGVQVRLARAEYGPPEYFVSHCWLAPFSQTVSSVVQHLRSKRDAPDSTRLWMDIFAINQRRAFNSTSVQTKRVPTQDLSPTQAAAMTAVGSRFSGSLSSPIAQRPSGNKDQMGGILRLASAFSSAAPAPSGGSLSGPKLFLGTVERLITSAGAMVSGSDAGTPRAEAAGFKFLMDLESGYEEATEIVLDVMASVRRGMLLVLDTQASALGRLWCLFEAGTSISLKGAGSVSLVIPPQLRPEVLHRAITRINLAKAQTTRVGDRMLIINHTHQFCPCALGGGSTSTTAVDEIAFRASFAGGHPASSPGSITLRPSASGGTGMRSSLTNSFSALSLRAGAKPGTFASRTSDQMTEMWNSDLRLVMAMQPLNFSDDVEQVIAENISVSLWPSSGGFSIHSGCTSAEAAAFMGTFWDASRLARELALDHSRILDAYTQVARDAMRMRSYRSPPKVMLPPTLVTIAGGAGSGKSSLAACMAMGKVKGIEVHAFHFFKRGRSNHMDLKSVVLSLAYQLASKSPLFAAYYSSLAPSQFLEFKTATAAFDLLIRRPAMSVCSINGQDAEDAPPTIQALGAYARTTPWRPIVFLLDGIDETCDSRASVFSISAGNGIGVGGTGTGTGSNRVSRAAVAEYGPSNPALILVQELLLTLPPGFAMILLLTRPHLSIMQPLHRSAPDMIYFGIDDLRDYKASAKAFGRALVERFGPGGSSALPPPPPAEGSPIHVALQQRQQALRAERGSGLPSSPTSSGPSSHGKGVATGSGPPLDPVRPPTELLLDSLKPLEVLDAQDTRVPRHSPLFFRTLLLLKTLTQAAVAVATGPIPGLEATVRGGLVGGGSGGGSFLDELYTEVFNQHWPTSNKRRQVVIRSILQVMAAAAGPVPLRILEDLGLRDKLRLLPCWGSMFFIQGHAVAAMHPSVMTWLQHRTAAQHFYASARLGHEALSEYFANVRQIVSARTGTLGPYGVWNAAVHLLQAELPLHQQRLGDLLANSNLMQQVFELGAAPLVLEHLVAAHLQQPLLPDVLLDVIRWIKMLGTSLVVDPTQTQVLLTTVPRGTKFAMKVRFAFTRFEHLHAKSKGTMILSTHNTLLNPVHDPPIRNPNPSPAGAYFAPPRSAGGGGSAAGNNGRDAGAAGQRGNISRSPTAATGAGLPLASTNSRLAHVTTARFSGPSAAFVSGKETMSSNSSADDCSEPLEPVGVSKPFVSHLSNTSTANGRGNENGSENGDVTWNGSVKEEVLLEIENPSFPMPSFPMPDPIAHAAHFPKLVPPVIRYATPTHSSSRRQAGVVTPTRSLAEEADSAGPLSLAAAATALGLTVDSTPLDPFHDSDSASPFQLHGGFDAPSPSPETSQVNLPGATAFNGKLLPPSNSSSLPPSVSTEIRNPSSTPTVTPFSTMGRHTLHPSVGEDPGAAALTSSLTAHRVTCDLGDETDDGESAELAGGGLSYAEPFPSALPAWPIVVSVLRGHTGRITRMAFCSDGRVLATSSHDRTIRLWDLEMGTCRAVLQGHGREVHSVAYSVDGNIVASASRDGSIRLWHAPSGLCRAVLAGHKKTVRCLAFGMCSTNTRRPKHQINLLSLGPGNRDNTSRDRRVSMVSEQRAGSLPNSECRLPSVPHVPSIADLPPSDAIRSYASGLCDLMNLPPTASLQGPAADSAPGKAAAESSLCNLLVSGSNDGTVRVWDGDTGVLYAALDGHLDAVYDVVFSLSRPAPEDLAAVSKSAKSSPPDPGALIDTLLATLCLDNTVRVWDLKNVAMAPAHRVELVGTIRPLTFVMEARFSPIGDFLATAGADRDIRIWSVKTGQCKHVFSGHEAEVTSLRFAGHGPIIMHAPPTRSASGLKASPAPPTTGMLVMISTSLDHTIRVWDVAAGLCRAVLRGHTGGVEVCVLFNPKIPASQFLSPPSTTTIPIDDAVVMGRSLGALTTFGGGRGPSGAAAFVQVPGAPTFQFPVASTGLTNTFPGYVACLGNDSIDMGGLLLATGSRDRTIRIWDMATGSCRAVLEGHTDWISHLDYSPASGMLVSAARDWTVALWDPKGFAGPEMSQEELPSPVTKPSAPGPPSFATSPMYDRSLR